MTRTNYIWYSQEEVDALTDSLFMQRHSARLVFNGKALYTPVNAGLADGKPVLYSAVTETNEPPSGHDDWELIGLARIFKCLVSTSDGLTEDGRDYALEHGLEETPWGVLDDVEQAIKKAHTIKHQPSIA